MAVGCATLPTAPPSLAPSQEPGDLTDMATILGTVPIHPLYLAGSIAWLDSSGARSPHFTRLLPDTPLAPPDLESKIVYQTVVSCSSKVEAKYLTSLTAALTADEREEVVLEYVFRARGPEYNTPAVRSAILDFIKREQHPGRQFYYVESVRYLTLKHKRYSRTTKSLGGTFFVDVDGSRYSSSEGFRIRELVAVDWLPVTLDSTAVPTQPHTGGGGGGHGTLYMY
jgi:hypothetical protein